MMKKALSVLLCLALLIMPFQGVMLFASQGLTVSAASSTGPLVYTSIAHLATVTPQTAITVTTTALSGTTLSACDVRLEGTTVGTGASVTFTPAAQGLKDGVYTLMIEATGSDGGKTLKPLTFYVDSAMDAAYAVTDGNVTASGTLTMHKATPLTFVGGYGTSQDGAIDLSKAIEHDASAQYHLTYSDTPVQVSSVSGIPYQTFDIALDGKTSGEIAVSYSGATKDGERMAVKAYNAVTGAWDTLDTFTGSGSVSALLDVATYSDGGTVHVAATLDYVVNGSNSMIWTTDPQHYTKFADLNEYYYKIYQYAAAQYQAGEIGYIINTGDLVDDRPSAAVAALQWQVADRAMSYAEAAGLPNGLVSGNHDVGDYTLPDFSSGTNTTDYSKFIETFPASRYNSERWYGGSLNNNVSHYDLVTIGNVDFIVLYLGYGREATDETIAWANQALKTYSHRTAIIATHEYLDSTTAVRADTGRAELIYQEIIDPNPNVKMVICGHDDGSLMLEKTASDGRTFYEILSDYQFVEAEDPDFYDNEHWIGSVPHCCGDGYLRIMTVEGDSLSSITYSPVTGRYNPYGDRESFTIDLQSGTPDRTFTTTRFSAAVVGGETASTAVNRIGVIEKDGETTYTPVVFASTPDAPVAGGVDTICGDAATPSNPYYAHAAAQAPSVSAKVDLLAAYGLSEPLAVSGGIATYNGQSVTVDLNKTPYLYYSFAQPADSKFTFALISDTSTAPWLSFLDVNKGGATLNYGADNWGSYTDHGQYFATSATGCIDMRTMISVAGATTWTVNELRFYSAMQKNVQVEYLFFGSAPIETAWPADSAYGAPATTDIPYYAHAAKDEPAVEQKVDLLAAVGLGNGTVVNSSVSYGDMALGLTIDLNKTPYLYYSFASPANSCFNFAFYNDMSAAPWLTFRDASKGGAVMNSGAANWGSYTQNEHYMRSSETGCIDMRTLLTDASAATWILNQLNFYNSNGTDVVVSYLFFGSASEGAVKDSGTPNDVAALQELIAQATAFVTDGYTEASKAELAAALSAANYAGTSDAKAVSTAFVRLEQALGAMEKVKTTIDPTTLKSVKNYSLSNTNWRCASTGAALTSSSSYLTVTQTDDGMFLKQSSAATHIWPAAHFVGTGAEYTVTPSGGMYVNLDVDANSNWMIELTITQGGKSGVVRLNEAIENAFHSNDTHGFEGVFQGVYDVSQAFYDFGFDPTATFTVTRTLFYIIGTGGNGTVNHFELMTRNAASSVDYSKLQSLVYYAQAHTQSMYTAASWSALQTAVNNANTTLGTTGLSQAAVNLARYKLQTAIDALVLNGAVEPDGSLLPEDLGLWIPDIADAIGVWRDADNATVIKNTNGMWPRVMYEIKKVPYVTVQDHQIALTVTVNDRANIQLLIDGEMISLNPYIGAVDDTGDLTSGEYRVAIPLSAISQLRDKVAVNVEAVQVYSVGAADSSAVTIRRLAIEDYDNYVWDDSMTVYGPAATPENPYYEHTAKNPPTVQKKVDLLKPIGLAGHPTVSGVTTYGNQTLGVDIDLNETPYLYYSFAVPAGSNFTFAFQNATTTAPWLTFLDASKDGAVMNSTVEVWNSYTSGQQYATVSQTGCIDMRELLLDPANAVWTINQINFYNTVGDGVVISYLFFGSAATDNGYIEEDIVTVTPGDVNDDGEVTTVDARLILSHVLGLDESLTALQLKAADVDGDTKISTTDIRLILQTLVNV